MIRVAVVDHRPVMRSGIEAILDAAPGVRVVAGATGGDEHAVAHALYRTAPDVVLVEDTAGRTDGVDLARRIKAFGPGPKVLLHADAPDPVQVATAMLAEADGIADSGGQPRELVEAVRTVASGGTAFPELGPRVLGDLARRVPVEDHPILAMRLAATPWREIADTLRIDARALRRRLSAMIARMRTATLPAAAAAAAG